MQDAPLSWAVLRPPGEDVAPLGGHLLLRGPARHSRSLFFVNLFFLFFCRHESGNTTIGVRVDHQRQLMQVLRFDIGGRGSMLLSPVKPDSRGECRLCCRSARTSLSPVARWAPRPRRKHHLTYVYRSRSAVAFT